jgi:phosphoribosyl 1,2-cyclic phosphate phosphodiesterase
MQIEILGSGGAITMPRPGCTCPVCTRARARGAPYSRSGPSVFIHGPDVLIDTPEEIKDQLNRAGIGRVAACLYSHWHPDHVAGRRVWENLNGDWVHWPPQHHVTAVYVPQQVAIDFRQWHGTWDQLTYMQNLGLIRLHELSDGDVVTLGGTRITPFRLAEDYVYGFLCEAHDRRALIVMDELLGWIPPDFVKNVDVAVLPMGLTFEHPTTGELLLAADHPLRQAEASFPQVLDIVRRLDARRVFLTHIELDYYSYDDLQALAAVLQADGYPIAFAYDTLKIEV